MAGYVLTIDLITWVSESLNGGMVLDVVPGLGGSVLAIAGGRARLARFWGEVARQWEAGYRRYGLSKGSTRTLASNLSTLSGSSPPILFQMFGALRSISLGFLWGF